eukprot:Skav232724  [mRNA]  locus=scaffold1843:794:1699:- [translate_table: standard]
MKAVHLRHVETKGVDDSTFGSQRVALLDGGATHALRQGAPAELQGAEPVEVELAHGSTVLFKREGSQTLLAREDVEPIIPLRLLIENGYKMTWTTDGVQIKHPQHGAIRCWRRQGCPVMDRQDGLALLHSLEELNVAPAVSPEVRAWWKKHYPNVPEEVLDYMKGQDQSWKGCGNLPWNRHLRRRCETSKMGVILHLFAGNQAMCKKWKDLEQLGYVVLTVDITNNNLENLHNAALWSYVSWLAQSGKLRILLGGPPCRTFSRLRHRRPGPLFAAEVLCGGACQTSPRRSSTRSMAMRLSS